MYVDSGAFAWQSSALTNMTAVGFVLHAAGREGTGKNVDHAQVLSFEGTIPPPAGTIIYIQ